MFNKDRGTKLGFYVKEVRGLSNLSAIEIQREGFTQCSAVTNRRIWNRVPSYVTGRAGKRGFK